jgi:hypothetical protein
MDLLGSFRFEVSFRLPGRSSAAGAAHDPGVDVDEHKIEIACGLHMRLALTADDLRSSRVQSDAA